MDKHGILQFIWDTFYSTDKLFSLLKSEHWQPEIKLKSPNTPDQSKVI